VAHNKNSAPPGGARAQGRQRLESVQILRGVAAMLVVYNHAGLLALERAREAGDASFALSESLANLGAIGVDVFFVISGFVMTLSARSFHGVGGAAEFLSLRFVRIAPLFYFFCAVQAGNLLLADVAIGRNSALNSIFFLPLFDKDQYSWPIHFLGWTLAFETIFYLIVAVLIAFGRSRDAFAILLPLLVLPLLGLLVGDGPPLRDMVLNPIVWEFAFGGVAFMLWQRGMLGRVRPWLLPLVLAGFGCLVIAAAQGAPFFGASGTVSGENSLARVALWGMPAFALLCLVLSADGPYAGMPAALLRQIGDASYSIYLSHLFVVEAGRQFMERWPLSPNLAFWTAFTLSAAVGWLVYRILEDPMLRFGRERVGQAIRWLRTAPRESV
jgi:exopolysaccharide production protein ExoZ